MSPSTNEPVHSLGDSINIATRSVHTKLNKLIVGRLPLAIPPGTKGPSNYVSGLLHITPIYHTFESLWQNVLNAPPPSEDDETEAPGLHAYEVCTPSSPAHHDIAVHPPTASPRVYSVLERVHSCQLERTEALKQDIMSITGWSAEQVEEQLGLATRFHVLSSFLGHIHQSVQERPHVLLAYAWVLYMALFSGGRFIRATVCRVHPGFWASSLRPLRGDDDNGDRSQESSEDTDEDAPPAPVQFFTFDGPNGGDDIKLAFKKRLAEAETLLTDAERDDVTVEARRIFEFMVELVGELDGVCRTDPRDAAADDEDDEDGPEGLVGRMSRLLGLRARDSVAVTRRRRGRAWARLAERRREGSGAWSGSGSNSPAGDDATAAAASEGSDSTSESEPESGPGHEAATVKFTSTARAV